MNNYENETLTTINIGGEDIYVKPSEYNELLSLDLVLDREDWMSRDVNNVNEVVKALFVINKIEDAWKLIEENLEDIDFSSIVQYEYFQLDRNAVKVFKYMIDNGIIDEETYAYFQVLSGDLSDFDFWKERFNKLNLVTLEQKLNNIWESFNGLDPYSIGLIKDNENLHRLIDETDNDSIDVDLSEYIMGNKTAVFFNIDSLVGFIGNGNIPKVLYSKVINVILQQSTFIEDYTDDDIASIFDFAFTILDSHLDDIKLDDLSKVKGLIKSNAFKQISNKNKLSLIANSLAFMNYPFIVKEYMKEYSDYDITGEDISEVLHTSNYPYVLSYKLLDIIDTSSFIIRYPFPSNCNMIYNLKKHTLFLNGYNISMDSLNAIQFKSAIDEYVGFDTLNIQGIDDDAIKNINSDFVNELNKHVSSFEELHEILLSISSLVETIVDIETESRKE